VAKQEVILDCGVSNPETVTTRWRSAQTTTGWRRHLQISLFRSPDRDAIARGFMQPPVDPAFVGFPAASPKSSRISWFMVVVGCFYFVWLTVGFSRAIPHFTKLYAGVELPPPPESYFPLILVSAIRVHRYGDAHRRKEIGRVHQATIPRRQYRSHRHWSRFASFARLVFVFAPLCVDWKAPDMLLSQSTSGVRDNLFTLD
jgi:hypothetical protein